jgi:hypothetical protein
MKQSRAPHADLSAIAKACGGKVDRILAVDLLEQLSVTIDLKRSVACLGIAPPSSSEACLIEDMDKAMHSCSEAFNNEDADKLASFFDPDFVLSTPSGELRGTSVVVALGRGITYAAMCRLQDHAVLRTFRSPVFFLAIWAIFAGQLAAQAPDTATFKGQISDPTHAAVSGAAITLRSTLTHVERGVGSDVSGSFSLSGLAIGRYSLLPDDDAEYYPFEVVIAAASPSAVLADQVKSLDWRKRRAKHKGKISFAIVDKGASVLSAALNLFP